MQNSVANGTNHQYGDACHAKCSPATIFGADAIRAATITGGEGADGLDAMRDAVTEEEAAVLLAQANISDLAGASEYFRLAVDSLLISTAMPYLDTLGKMIRGAAYLLARLQNLRPKVQRLAAVLAAVLAVGGPLLGTMAANWDSLSGAMRRAEQVSKPAIDSLRETVANLRSGDFTFQETGPVELEELQKAPRGLARRTSRLVDGSSTRAA